MKTITLWEFKNTCLEELFTSTQNKHLAWVCFKLLRLKQYEHLSKMFNNVDKYLAERLKIGAQAMKQIYERIL